MNANSWPRGARHAEHLRPKSHRRLSVPVPRTGPTPRTGHGPASAFPRTVGIEARGPERPLALRHGGGARALEADVRGDRADGRPADGRPPRASHDLRGPSRRRLAHSGCNRRQRHDDHASHHRDHAIDSHTVGDVVGLRIGRSRPSWPPRTRSPSRSRTATQATRSAAPRRRCARARHRSRCPPGRPRSGCAPGPRRSSLPAHGSRSPLHRTRPPHPVPPTGCRRRRRSRASWPGTSR